MEDLEFSDSSGFWKALKGPRIIGSGLTKFIACNDEGGVLSYVPKRNDSHALILGFRWRGLGLIRAEGSGLGRGFECRTIALQCKDPRCRAEDCESTLVSDSVLHRRHQQQHHHQQQRDHYTIHHHQHLCEHCASVYRTSFEDSGTRPCSCDLAIHGAEFVGQVSRVLNQNFVVLVEAGLGFGI